VPIYEYQCKSCKAVYELRQGFDAATTHKCEECGKGTAKRVLHAPPVVFKGSGWYLTDSRSSKSAVADSEPSSSGSSSHAEPAAGESKTDSKPAAAKKESKSDAKSSGTTESAAAG
jgi:putative FmdB family regulatory protein